MDKELHRMTIRDLLEARVASAPEHPFIFFEDQEITYREFDDMVNKLANSLLRLGLKKGDMVGVWLDNCPEFLCIFFAAAKIGLIVVPMNTAYVGPELQYAVEHSEQTTMITQPDHLDIVVSIRPNCPHLKRVIVTGDEPLPDAILFYSLIEKSNPSLAATDIVPDDIIANMYTSGTTSRPKGVLLTHSAFIWTGDVWSRAMKLTPADRLMVLFPLFHGNALGISTFSALVAGASLVPIRRFSVRAFWDQVRRYGVTEINAVGSIHQMLLSQPETEMDKGHTLRIALSGIWTSLETITESERRYGFTILTGYSLTESMIATGDGLDCLDKRKPLSIGYAWPEVEMKVVDNNGKEVLHGTQGEFIFKSPAFMMGYFKNPQTTAETIKDGWLYTGDIGYEDEDGCFWFCGRKKDMIKRRGENVATAEVEDVLSTHPKVLESAVIGVPDPYAEEEVKAYIRLKPSEAVPPEEIIEWCRERLSYFKVPRYIEFREDFPRGTLDKILKRALREEKADLTEGCYDAGTVRRR